MNMGRLYTTLSKNNISRQVLFGNLRDQDGEEYQKNMECRLCQVCNNILGKTTFTRNFE